MNERINDPISAQEIGSVPERLTALMGADSLRKFSGKVGLSEGALRKILKGSVPSLNSAIKIATACGVSLDWFAMGKEGNGHEDKITEGKPRSGQSNAVTVFDEEFCLVPGFHIQVSSGKTDNDCDTFNQKPKRWMAFRKKYLDYRKLNPERCAVVFVKGDSMADTISDNDSLLIDRDSTTPIDGHIYVIRLGNELYAKRLQKSFDGSIILISDNKEYEAITVPKEKLNELCIVGKVVQRATDL